MQISQIQTTNPNLNLGLWVEHVNYPQAGAGQIQQFISQKTAYFIEHWQKSVVDGLSLNGLLYQPFNLRLAEYLYMGHYRNTLYYVHNIEVRKMEFTPVENILTTTDFDEAQTKFTTRKTYLKKHHQTHSKLITSEDEEFIFDYWQSTQGGLAGLIPYIIQCKESYSMSITRHLEQQMTMADSA